MSLRRSACSELKKVVGSVFNFIALQMRILLIVGFKVAGKGVISVLINPFVSRVAKADNNSR